MITSWILYDKIKKSVIWDDYLYAVTGCSHKHLKSLASHIFAWCFTGIIQGCRQIVLAGGGSKFQFMTASSIGNAIVRDRGYHTKQPRIFVTLVGALCGFQTPVFQTTGYLFAGYTNFHYRIMYYNLQCTVQSTKQWLEQRLALKYKDKDKDLLFKDKDKARIWSTRTRTRTRT